MNLSYWEIRSWLSDLDFCIVGSGITGLSCALELQRLQPGARILLLERGTFPQGASTKNAGFACFGSLTEILEDLKSHSEEEVQQLVAWRYSGINLLRARLGDDALDFRQYGGYEIFLEQEQAFQEAVLGEMDRVNSLLKPVFGRLPFELRGNDFGLARTLPRLVCNPMEGQIDTGRAMHALLDRVRQNPIQILNGVRLLGYEDEGSGVHIRTDQFECRAKRLLLATNGFAAPQTGLEVLPARAQVLVTAPIPGLRLRGSFHMEAGYYYFRNVGERVLLGGGRNLDKAGETTEAFGQTPLIQERLEQLLREVILPGAEARIEYRWSGIMGVGPQKKPLLQRLSPNVSCGVRLGGMGVAIGSHVGAELAQLATDQS